MYGEGAVTDQTCQKLFAEFCAGDFLLVNAPQLAGPVEAAGDQSEAFTENNHSYTTQVLEIANMLKIAKSINYW